jgi:pilus assembly protein TadC
MPRKRSNKPKKWWRDRKRVARILRAGVLVTFLVVALLAILNFWATTQNHGPGPLSLTVWLYISTALLLVAGAFMLFAILWLRRNNELPKERNPRAH